MAEDNEIKVKVSADTEEFGQAMKELAEQVETAAEKLKDAFAEMRESAISPLELALEAIKESVVESLSKGIDNVVESLGKMTVAKDAASGVEKTAQALGKMNVANTAAADIEKVAESSGRAGPYAAAAATAIYLLGKAFHDGTAEMNSMNAALGMTGNYAGMTRGDMVELAESVEHASSATSGESKKLVTDLVASGQMSGEVVKDVARLTTAYAEKTGEDVGAITPKMIALFKDPAKGAEDLNKTMHFLTATQLDHIRTLTDLGEKEQAQVELADALQTHLDNVEHNVGALEHAWIGLKKAASSAWDAMSSIGREESVEEKLNKVEARLSTYGGASKAKDTVSGTVLEKEVNDLLAKREELLQKIGAEKSRAAAESAKAHDLEVQQQARQIAIANSNVAKITDLTGKIVILKEALEQTPKDQALLEALDALEKRRSALQNGEKEGDKPTGGDKGKSGNKSSGAASDLEAWREELKNKHIAEHNFFHESIEMDLDFWKQKLEKTKAGSKDHAQVVGELYSAEKALARQQFADKSEDYKEEIAQARAGSIEKIEIAGQYANYVGSVYGFESREYKKAQADVVKAAKERAEELKRIDKDQAEQEIAALQSRFDIEKENDEFLVQIGRMTKEEQLQNEIAYEKAMFEARQKALKEEIAALDKESEAYSQAKGKELQLEQQHALKVQQLNNKLALDQRKNWDTMLQSMKSSFANALNGLLTKTMTWKQALSSIFKSLASTFSNIVVNEIVSTWLHGEKSKTTATQEESVLRTAIEKLSVLKNTGLYQMFFGEKKDMAAADVATQITNAATETATQKATGAASILSNAAIAATAAMASVAAIPFYGWAMAPEVGAATYAEAMAYMPSAEGGWDVPAGVNPITQLHEQEMVLPAKHADVIRSLADNGGVAGGGAVHVNITAMDAKSVRDYFKANSDKLAPALRKMARNFTPTRA